MARLSIYSSLLSLFSFQLLITPPAPTSSANIIFFHLLATLSHRTSIWPLTERLVQNGDKVTYIYPGENLDASHPNVEEIIPSKMVQINKEHVGEFDINFRLNNTVDAWTWRSFSKCADLCSAFYDSPETIKWLSRPNLKYDLVMVDSALGECAYGLVHRFKAKHIIFAPVLPGFMWDGFGLVPESSSIPEFYFHPKPTEMGFTSRLKTTLAPFMFRLAFLDFVRRVDPVIKEKLNSPDMPSILEFEKNTSLVFLLSHFLEDYPMSLPPMMITYSGLWCGKDKIDKGGKPLPQDISEFINQGSDKENQGFIYVSFGSSLSVGKMPEYMIDNFFKAFEAFPKIKFLWRWTGPEPKNKPKNIMLRKWWPQRQILQHPKIKAFITQAGRPSTQEALCNAVPLISFPIWVDQDNNANRLEYLGVSINFDIANFTAEGLQNGIKDIIENPSYSIKMKEMSAMYRDRPMDPVDNLLYWTEYVLRHNTSHLKPLGMHQTWWQRRLLDVYAVLALAVVIILGITLLLGYFTLKLTLRLVSSKKVKKE